MKSKIKKLLRAILILGLVGVLALAGINLWVTESVRSRILTQEQAAKLDADCIVVLGCQVRSDGTPSHMLEDRLKRGVALYELGASSKILMSGDHGTKGYDEVNTMKAYAIEAGIPTEDIFMDHAGFSTYETIYRAKEIFGAKKIIVVTQQYHLYRALYIAEALGVEAYGVSSDYHIYVGQYMREIREILARVKDVGSCIFQPAPTYGGDVIPISGDGNLTNDENSDFT